MVVVRATTPEGPCEIGAALVGKKNEPRLVTVFDYDMDMAPAESMAFFFYGDKPGMIGRIGTILGEQNINIGSMQVGRADVAGQALMGITVDTPVSRELLDHIREAAGLDDAWNVEL
jgi:D-3-phosphoglycerate dehydrogenase